MTQELQQRLNKLAASAPGFVEIRFHHRQSRSVTVQNKLVKQSKSSITSGIGIRV